MERAIVPPCSRCEGRKPGALEPLSDMVPRRIKAAAAGAPALARRRRQPFDVGLHSRDVELWLDLRKRLSWLEFDRLALQRQVAGQRRVPRPPLAPGLHWFLVAGQDQPGILP